MNIRTKEELLSAKWRNNILLPSDDRNIVRTGKEWFDRYMVYPWEKGKDFSEVRANNMVSGAGASPRTPQPTGSATGSCPNASEDLKGE
jgi:hypothetical protein